MSGSTRLPDGITECDTRGCMKLATTRVADSPRCMTHGLAERRKSARTPTTTIPRQAHQPAARYTDETVRQVVRYWAAANSAHGPGTGDIRIRMPHLCRALDAMHQEYRAR